jgi:hypothetical protein
MDECAMPAPLASTTGVVLKLPADGQWSVTVVCVPDFGIYVSEWYQSWFFFRPWRVLIIAN